MTATATDPRAFDRVLNACSGGWTLSVLRGKKTAATFELPLPEGIGTLEGLLRSINLEPGVYRCFVRAKGRGARARRQGMSKFGPVQRVIDLGEDGPGLVLLDPEAAARAAVTRAHGEDDGADYWTDREDTAKAKGRALEAEAQLRQVEERQQQLDEHRTAGLSVLEIERQREMREIRDAIKEMARASTAPVADSTQTALLKMVMDQNALLVKTAIENRAPPGQAGTAASTSRTFEDMDKLLGLIDRLRSEGPSASAGEDTDIRAALRFGEQVLKSAQDKRRARESAPDRGVEGSPAPVPVAAPAAAPPPSPRAHSVDPAESDPGRQRVAAFLDLVEVEMRNQTLPIAAAYRLADTEVFQLAPGPLRQAIERREFGDVLTELQQRLPEPRWVKLRDLVTTDEASRTWLRQFMEALADTDVEDETTTDLVAVDG